LLAIRVQQRCDDLGDGFGRFGALLVRGGVVHSDLDAAGTRHDDHGVVIRASQFSYAFESGGVREASSKECCWQVCRPRRIGQAIRPGEQSTAATAQLERRARSAEPIIRA